MPLPSHGRNGNYKMLDEQSGTYEGTKSLHSSSKGHRILSKAFLAVVTGAILYCTFAMLFDDMLLLAAVGAANSPTLGVGTSPKASTSSDTPQYFRISPELWAGPTATGRAPFLAQTNPVSFAPTVTFIPNVPLETAQPIAGGNQNQSVFRLMGQLSPYSPGPGFGVGEYPLPPGAEIVQVQMLSRHGSRYPTTGDIVFGLGEKIKNNTGKFKATGALTFLNTWTMELGAEILVPRGRQELFESGVLHYYQYAQLYNPNSKIIARTTTQDRMLKSAEYFLAGFFGLEWTNNATIEVIIEQDGFNNSLAGYKNCRNANTYRNSGGRNATQQFVQTYLQNATDRLQAMIGPEVQWSITDSYAAQNMCPYETVAYGYSAFCDLFTYDEWVNYEYSLDLYFAGSSSFQSPTGRAVGLGYVQEVIARLEHHLLGYSGSQINVTLDSMKETFPLNQTLYFDFSHDTNIMSILTAFGFKQFNTFLPATHHLGPHNLTVSHLEPFGARLDIEIIKTPHPLSANREYDSSGKETTYLHFVLNQRTLPLGLSFPECGNDRVDGWCELDTFLMTQKDAEKLAKYDFACNGEYDTVYGEIDDGAPK